MNLTVSGELLSRFADFVAARFGLHFPRKRWRDLERGIARAAAEFGFEDNEACFRWLLDSQLSREQLDVLASSLTIGETYFFREKKSFEALENRILPDLISSRREKGKSLRIWSAGCSTGEEAYSIAILLRKLIVDPEQWNITILATDLNPRALRKAEKGEYGDWSFRGVPHWVKGKYFTLNREGRFEVTASVRKMVTFAGLNLAEDPYPSLFNNTNAMDIIFCRNVLMYFSPEQVKKVIYGFHHSLIHGGWLVVSPCETSHTLFREYETLIFNDAYFYRKVNRRNTVSEPPVEEVIISDPPFPLPDTGADEEKTPLPPVGAKTRFPDREVVISGLDAAVEMYRKGQYDDAAARLRDMLKNAESTGDFSACSEEAKLLVRILADKGEFAAALEWSEKAVSANRLDPETRYLQAVIFQETGGIDAAIAALKQTLYLDQAFVLAHFTLANLLLVQGKKKEAARHMENARSLLESCGDDEILPGSEGMSARRLGEIVAQMATKAVA